MAVPPGELVDGIDWVPGPNPEGTFTIRPGPNARGQRQLSSPAIDGSTARRRSTKHHGFVGLGGASPIHERAQPTQQQNPSRTITSGFLFHQIVQAVQLLPHPGSHLQHCAEHLADRLRDTDELPACNVEQ